MSNQITTLTDEEKSRTAIIEWARGGTKVATYPTVEKMLSDVEIAKFLGAKVCTWLYCAGWIWS